MFPAGVEIIELQTEDGILRAEALTEALGQFPEPTLILINAPCNPTGANYTPEEREAFFAAVLAHTKSTTVASDDPYGKLVFDREPYDIRKVLKRGEAEKTCFAEGRLAVFRSVSKEYGLAGERVGYLATKHASMLKSLHLWNENKGGGMGVRNQELAEAALLYGDGFITRTVESLREKRQKLYDAVKALQFADMQNPRGTIYGWVDFAGLQGKTVPAAHSETGAAYTIASPADMMRYLIYVAGVCGVPGTPFYAPDSPARLEDWHVRISFCCEMDQLERVIANLTKAEAALV
jgi:aspartate aminotransferase